MVMKLSPGVFLLREFADDSVTGLLTRFLFSLFGGSRKFRRFDPPNAERALCEPDLSVSGTSSSCQWIQSISIQFITIFYEI